MPCNPAAREGHHTDAWQLLLLRFTMTNANNYDAGLPQFYCLSISWLRFYCSFPTWFRFRFRTRAPRIAPLGPTPGPMTLSVSVWDRVNVLTPPQRNHFNDHQIAVEQLSTSSIAQSSMVTTCTCACKVEWVSGCCPLSLSPVTSKHLPVTIYQLPASLAVGSLHVIWLPSISRNKLMKVVKF